MGFYDAAYGNVANQGGYVGATIAGYLLHKGAIKEGVKDAVGNQAVDNTALTASEGLEQLNSLEEPGSEAQVQGIRDYIGDLKGQGAQLYAQQLVAPYEQRLKALQQTEQMGQGTQQIKTATNAVLEYLQQKKNGGAR